MKKRMLSLILVIVMLLGVLPGGMTAFAEEAAVDSGVITLDFQASMERAAQEDFWADLPAVKTQNGADTVRVGLLYPKRDPESVIAAYGAMNAWLLENEGWAVNETASGLTDGSGNKIYFSYDEKLDWGLSHNPYFMNYTDGRSDMALDVNVETAGWYNLTLGISLSTSSSKDYGTDGNSDAGGSYADVIVGGETVYKSLCAVGTNSKVDRSVGAVYLEEGVNTINLRTVANFWNAVGATMRSNFNLYNMVLTPLNTVSIEQGKKQVINLNNTYLPFDVKVSTDTHSVVSSDVDIAAASINEGGSVVVKGAAMGEAEVEVYEGDTLLCTIPVEITERVSPVFVPETIRMDFMQFAAQAQSQSWWTGLKETTVDGIRYFGSSGWSDHMTDDQKDAYSQMQKWLKANTCWSFDEAGGYTSTTNLKRVFINTNSAFDYGVRFYGAMLGYGDSRGQLALTVNVPEEGEGLYNLTLDMLNEALGDADLYKVSGSEGCGRGNIMVNGEVVYEQYLFSAPKTSREVLSFGTVYLTEGANSIVIDMTGDYFGGNSNARRAVNLRAIDLKPLFGQTVEVGAKDIVDLRTTYLAFDEAVSDALAVTSSEEDVAEAFVDANGNIVVTGKAVGSSEVTVTDGDTKICTMDYEVVAKTNLVYDFTKASSVTAGGFAKVEDYEDMNVDDGIGSDLWAFDAVSPRTVAQYSAAESAAVFTGEAGNTLSFKLQVTADGWHSPALRLYKNALGGDVAVYLRSNEEEVYLGTVDTYAAAKAVDVQTLRSVYLTQGDYVLTLELLGSNTFLWSDLTMKKAQQPSLVLTAGNISQKQGRLMETVLAASWDDGRNDDLYMADWTVEVSDPEGITATVVPGTLTSAPVLQATGLKPGSYEITVSANINGAETAITVQAEVLAHVALETFDVNIACIDEGILVRNTTREFDYDMVGVDGDVIYPNEINVKYEVSDPAVAVVDEEKHTIRAIANGDVSVTITAEAGGMEFTKTLRYTVADVGENRMDDESSYFEGGTGGYLLNSATKPGVENAICWTDIADDGTGNMAIRVVANPEVTNREAVNAGELVLANGHLAEIKGGQLYEMSFKMKAEGYKKAEGAKSDWRFIFQLYDYQENARTSLIVREYSSSVYGKPEELSADEWTTYTVRVRAPIDTDEILYLTPRITYGPFVGFYPTDQDVKGWEGTFWIDDIEIREVAFDHVDMELQGPLNAIGREVLVKVTPMTSTGHPIIFDDEAFPTVLETRSTNEDVIAIDGNVTPLYVGDYFHNDDYVTIPVSLVGLNARAQALAKVKVNDEVREGVLDVNVTDMPDQLRDISFTLDGFESLVLKKDETAQGALTARTTQLTQYSEEEIRALGSVYFTSSNTKVATVDTVTGLVTCVGEGEAVITGYVNIGSEIKTDTVLLTVTDDTDLASISISAPVDYVGVGNKLQFAVEGLKASGGAADMSKYPVAWSVDETALADGIAVIDQNGRLTGLREGTVTVTATIGVMRTAITSSMTVRVVANEQLGGGNVFYELIQGHGVGFEDFTVEENGIAVNWDETYNGGSGMIVTNAGLEMNVPVGQSVVLDFKVHKDGWYQVQSRGAARTDGSASNVFVDDAYVGIMEFFGSGGHWGATGGGNTVWLEAGVHSLRFTSYSGSRMYIGGLRLFATTDPNEVAMEMTAGQTDLVIGQTTDLTLELKPANGKPFTLLQQAELGDYTNCYTLTSSDPGVVSVSGMTLTAKAAGTATVTLNGEIDYKPVSASVTITVKDANIASAELTAENTSFKPGAEAQQLTLTVYGVDGAAMTQLPEGASVRYTTSDASVASVDANGLVTIGQVGAAKIIAEVTEEGHTVEAVLWLTVTEGKTKPTLYSEEERANARENVLKYDWAWAAKEAAVKKADQFVEKLDYIYSEMLFAQTWPGNTSSTGYQNDSQGKICRYCKADLEALFGHHPFITDPINNPWKITCPACYRDFPSNDFGAYYRSGIGEDGLFHEELADQSLLTNDLYPEMGEGWGVDNGWGYDAGTYDVDGSEQDYLFISCYIRAMHGASGANTINVVLNNLRDAYLYTGDEKYGNAGAILVDRLADIYPTYNLSDWPIMTYADADGNGGIGRMVGCIWDAIYSQYYARAFDAFWDCMDNDEVVEYLRQYASWKGLTPEEITPEQIRNNCEENLILELFEAAKMNDLNGNFGMEEAGISCAAVALDREPYTTEMLDWVYHTNETGGNWGDDSTYALGGDVGRMLTEEVDRDGLGNEGSTSYNSLWEMYLIDMADALVGVEGYDLWENSQFVNMFTAMMRLTIDGAHTPLMHETSGLYQILGTYASVERMTTAFISTGMSNPELAKAIYTRNGNKVDGLRGNIFTKDPESGVRNAVQQLVEENGEWDHSDSAMMAGFGIAILRDGPARYVAGTNDADYSTYWMYYGYTQSAHHQKEVLNFDLTAFGISLSGNMGYPLMVNSNPERYQWVMNTISNNTVVVDRAGQLQVKEGGFPRHFADADRVKIMDAEAEHVYGATDIYRRTMVTVDNGDGVNYAVDFFRVLGGHEHVYSFHAASITDPEVEGLDMTVQPMGTYLGADVPFGPETNDTYYDDTDVGGGYSWLYNVSRDEAPSNSFTIDWKIEDFYNHLPSTAGTHVKLHMVSEEPVSDVALADGNPPQDGRNPEHLEFVLIRNQGADGMDSLFTAVYEPYQTTSYIEKTELADIVLRGGTENVTDKAAALKVTLKSGRVDYIVYATDPDCTYEVDGKLTFRGFAGVASYENGTLVYAWGDEVSMIADSELGTVVENDAAIEGTVLSFTEGLGDHYTMTIETDREITEEEILGKYIYVNNDGVDNAAYRVHGAVVNGTTVEIDLNTQTLVREYVDEWDFDKGFVHNIAVGDTFTIPMMASFDVASMFTYTSDVVVKTGDKLSLTTGVAGAGVTYEAEGLTTGMKFNASTGLLTWTPSKAQAGKYLITVKAVKDGEVMGEMSFTIYAVTYTGSTYDASECSHAKAVTYGDDVVCPACGTVTKKEAEVVEKFDIAGSNMTLGNELKLNVMVKADHLTDGEYIAKITHNGETTEQTLVKYNSSYYFVTVTVSAKQMADTITVEVFNEAGEAVSNVYETSVRDYAMKILGNDAMSANVKTLVVDMLNYGAAAQAQFAYNTEDPANSLLTDAQKEMATASVTVTNKQVKGNNFYGSNLSLEDKILLNLYFRNVTDGMYAEITYRDYKGEAKLITVSFSDFEQYTGSLYKIPVDEIVLADAFSLVTVTVYTADGTVHGTASDSVESYVARAGNSEINEAIMKFAISAGAYLK